MECKNCGYALWNLRSGTCPECGTAFRISEQQFKPNAVQFCCPYCAQAYYGTDPFGLIQPREFDCVTCRKHIHIDEMVLLPAPGVDDASTRHTFNPWTQGPARGMGVFTRWYKTIGAAMLKAQQLGDAIRANDQTGPAFKFWALNLGVRLGVGLVIGLVFTAVMGGFLSMAAGAGGGPPGGAGGFTTAMLFSQLWGLVSNLLISVVVLGIWGVVAYAILRGTGPMEGTLRRTFAVIMYASGIMVLTLIPCAGGLVGPIWMLVSVCIMLPGAHKVTSGRAATAGILGALAAMVIGYGGYFALLLGFGAAAGGFPGMGVFTPPVPAGQSQVQTLTSALFMHEMESDTGFPLHASELLLGESSILTPMDFTADQLGSGTVAIGGTPVSTLTTAPEATLKNISDALKAAQPADVVAHRVGDYVFTYHGITNPAQDPKLWLVVEAPLGGGSPDGMRTVGLADGTTRHVFLAGNLQSQNALRTMHGLPPLADPDTVTEASPQRSGIGGNVPPPATTNDEEQAGDENSDEAGNEAAGED